MPIDKTFFLVTLELSSQIEKEELMAFTFTNSKGNKYYLHCKKIKRSTGKDTLLYYFAKEVKKEFAVDAVPAGKQVVELKSGLPALKKI